MKVVLLCAGYGTRLRRDLEAAGGRYAHLLGLPKPLLPVAGQPLLTRWVQEVWAELGESVSVAAVVNDRFLEDFRAWREGLGEERGAKVTLISDGTTRNEDRLGAVACMQLALDREVGADDHVLFIAGDTLFQSSFSLSKFAARFRELNDGESPASSLIVETGCADEEVHKRGIIEWDKESGRVLSFLEKPSPEETSSRSQSPAFYLVHASHLREIGTFLEENKDKPLEARDATGNFVRHLVSSPTCPVFAYHIEERFDIGGLDTYLRCCRAFEEKAP